MIAGFKNLKISESFVLGPWSIYMNAVKEWIHSDAKSPLAKLWSSYYDAKRAGYLFANVTSLDQTSNLNLPKVKVNGRSW